MTTTPDTAALLCVLLLALGGAGCSERKNSADGASQSGPKPGRDPWAELVRAEFVATMREHTTMDGANWTFSLNRLGNLLFGGKGYYRVEVRNVAIAISPESLEEADRLNGVQWRGTLSLTGAPHRSTLIGNQDYVPIPLSENQPFPGIGGILLIPTNRVMLTDVVATDWQQVDFFGGESGLGPVFQAEIRNGSITWSRSGPEGMGLVPLGSQTNRLEALLQDFEK